MTKLTEALRAALCCTKFHEAEDTETTNNTPEPSSTETPLEDVQVTSVCVAEGIVEVTNGIKWKRI